MDLYTIQHTAGEALLRCRSNHRQLILLHTGCLAAFTLLLALADYVLDQLIATTGGLSGMETKGILTTVQTVLQLGQRIAVPFWQFGYLAVALGFLRDRSVSRGTLLAGFRKWDSLLRFSLLQGVIYLVVGTGAAMISSILFSMTPFYGPLAELMLPVLESQTMPDTATLEAISQAYIPMLVIFAVVFLLAAAPTFYRFRMAEYILMDGEERSALRSLLQSAAMMRGKRLALFRLDLSFWWFYLLDGLTAVVCFADILLPLAGVSLPWPEEVGYFLFLTLSLVLQLGLYVWQKNRLAVTYAAFYEAVSAQPAPTPPAPKDHPWS